MQVTTQSSINISESLASFLLASHIKNNVRKNAVFEKRLNNVKTGKYSIADVYIPSKNSAIEVKSIAHGSSALKGVMQASMYKEAVDDGIFCMQRPRRKSLRDTIESMSNHLGVGVVYINAVPTICNENTMLKATGGCSKPFELWKRGRYTLTKKNIIAKSRTEWIDEYIQTLEQTVCEYSDSIFEFVIEPDSSTDGLSKVFM
jgi:hypothetical protein